VRYTGHAKGGPPEKKGGRKKKGSAFLRHSGIKKKMVLIPSAGFFAFVFSWDFLQFVLSV
jgi:hypothetical protein